MRGRLDLKALPLMGADLGDLGCLQAQLATSVVDEMSARTSRPWHDIMAAGRSVLAWPDQGSFPHQDGSRMTQPTTGRGGRVMIYLATRAGGRFTAWRQLGSAHAVPVWPRAGQAQADLP